MVYGEPSGSTCPVCHSTHPIAPVRHQRSAAHSSLRIKISARWPIFTGWGSHRRRAKHLPGAGISTDEPGRAAFLISGSWLSTCSRSLNVALRHLGSSVGGHVSEFLKGTNLSPIIGTRKAEGIPNLREFAWAITFGRCIARFRRSLFRQGLPSYCGVWIARAFSPSVDIISLDRLCLDRAPTPSGVME